jgi:hypothetical protein
MKMIKKNERSLRYDRKHIHLVGVIKGLTEELKTVRSAYYRYRPHVIGLHISQEALDELQDLVAGKIAEVEISNYDEIYARRLAEYGEVQVPPPALVEAVLLGNKNNIPVLPLDMGELEYADTFCEAVSTFQLMMHSFKVQKLKRRKFKAATPEEFVFEWDRFITKLKGFKHVEEQRETHIAMRIIELTENYRRVLAILELERFDGVWNKILTRLPKGVRTLTS